MAATATRYLLFIFGQNYSKCVRIKIHAAVADGRLCELLHTRAKFMQMRKLPMRLSDRPRICPRPASRPALRLQAIGEPVADVGDPDRQVVALAVLVAAFFEGEHLERLVL